MLNKMLTDVSLTIKRNKRKTVSIYVERDGTVTVIAPEDSTDNEIEEVIEAKKYQIYKAITEWELTNSTKIEREFVNGQSFLYLGRNYRLEIVKKKQKLPLMLKNGYFLLKKDAKPIATQLFVNFYKEKGLPRITERVERYKKWIDVNPKKIRIMELKNRWASCSEKGNLNFHWKCIMAPLDVLNYIVVHELIHLVIKNHTKKFWNEIDKVIPEYQKHIEWLRINGAAMDL
jgi:predicted metal-dependent hydrolase